MRFYKRRRNRCALLLFVFCSSVALWPQEPSATASRTVVKQAGDTVEVGELGGAPYRIDLPEKWNHKLVVMHHGYSVKRMRFNPNDPPRPTMSQFLQRGYAVIQSAYSETGWALNSGFADTEKLREYFEHTYGIASERYVTGASMGGALTMETMERNPAPYMGALNLCGAVGSSIVHAGRRLAQRAAFDYYFPGLLPSLDNVPPDFAGTPELSSTLEKALASDPGAASAMRNITTLPTNSEVVRMMIFYTVFLGDLEHKSGGLPVDNRNTVYGGTSENIDTDYALNDGVRRYSADAAARQYLLKYYEPSGKVTKPVIALHTGYDANVPVSQLTAYHQTIDRAGYGQNYVQQYVHRKGHCMMTPEQIGKAFDELIDWTHGGKPPASGLLP